MNDAMFGRSMVCGGPCAVFHGTACCSAASILQATYWIISVYGNLQNQKELGQRPHITVQKSSFQRTCQIGMKLLLPFKAKPFSKCSATLFNENIQVHASGWQWTCAALGLVEDRLGFAQVPEDTFLQLQFNNVNCCHAEEFELIQDLHETYVGNEPHICLSKVQSQGLRILFVIHQSSDETAGCQLHLC